MRKFILLSAATLLSAVVSAQTVARMDDLKPEQKSMAVSLKLTGELSTTATATIVSCATSVSRCAL